MSDLLTQQNQKIKCRDCNYTHTWEDVNENGEKVICVKIRMGKEKHVIEIPVLNLQPQNYFSDQIEEKAVGKAG